MTVTTLIHVSLCKSRQITAQDALPHIKLKCRPASQTLNGLVVRVSAYYVRCRVQAQVAQVGAENC